jgi:hypothetical protein
MSSRNGHHNGEARDLFWRLRNLALYTRRPPLPGRDDTGAPLGVSSRPPLAEPSAAPPALPVRRKGVRAYLRAWDDPEQVNLHPLFAAGFDFLNAHGRDWEALHNHLERLPAGPFWSQISGALQGLAAAPGPHADEVLDEGARIVSGSFDPLAVCWWHPTL